MGFCLGGKLAYLTATRHDVDAAVSFYGVGIEEALDESGGIACPVLMHFAGEDAFVPQTAVDAIIETLRERGRRCGSTSIPSVDHAFYNHDPRRGIPPAVGHGRPFAYHRPAAGCGRP